MGDNCCDPLTMGRLQRFVEAALPGVYVRSVMVGESPKADTMHGRVRPPPLHTLPLHHLLISPQLEAAAGLQGPPYNTTSPPLSLIRSQLILQESRR